GRLCFRLGDGELRSGDFALVAIEDRQGDVEEKCSSAGPRDVRETKGGVQVLLAVGPRQLQLRTGSGDASFRRLQVGTGPQSPRFQVVEVQLQGLKGEDTVN